MSRQKNKRIPRLAISIIVDGKDENWYIENIKKHCTSKKLREAKLYPELPTHKKVDELFDLAKNKIEFDEYDWALLIVDFDEPLNNPTEMERFKLWYGRYMDKKGKYKWMEKLTVIVNNPCLEYWFLMHFKRTNKFYQSYSELLKDLKSIDVLRDYDKTKEYYNGNPNIFKRLGEFDGLNTARSNSEQLGDFTIDTCREKGMTEMDEFFKFFD